MVNREEELMMNESSKKNIGNIIKEARINKNKTQQNLADECYLSRTYISDIESGRYSPSVGTLINIFNKLNINFNLIKNVVNTDINNE